MTFVTCPKKNQHRKFWRRMGERKKRGSLAGTVETFLRLANSSIPGQGLRPYFFFFFLLMEASPSYRRHCGLWAIIRDIYVFTIWRLYDSGWFYWLRAKNATPQTALKKDPEHICKVCHVVTHGVSFQYISSFGQKHNMRKSAKIGRVVLLKKYNINYRVNREYVLRLQFLYRLWTKKRKLCHAFEKYSRFISSTSKSILDAC